MSEKQETFTPGPWTNEDCTPGESTGLRFAINSKDNVIARTTDGPSVTRLEKQNARYKRHIERDGE